MKFRLFGSEEIEFRDGGNWKSHARNLIWVMIRI